MHLATLFLLCSLLKSGKSSKPQSPPIGSHRIANGENTKEGEFPHHAVVLWKGKTHQSLCGGSIIDKNRVVTAAHCVISVKGETPIISPKDVTRFRIVPGAKAMSSDTEYAGDVYEVESIDVHPCYINDDKNKNFPQHDIAVIHLKSSISFTSNIKAIKLPWSNQPAKGDATVIGYGGTEQGKNSKVLLKASVKILDGRNCAEIQKFAAKSFMLCAGPQGRICQGDSGGSLISKSGDYLAGLTSWSVDTKCQAKNVGVFTDVSKYKCWIFEKKWNMKNGEIDCTNYELPCPSHGTKIEWISKSIFYFYPVLFQLTFQILLCNIILQMYF